jgi:hypothetical protein
LTLARSLILLLLSALPALALDDASVPPKFPIPWANSATAPYIRDIPEASQIGIQNGAASLTTGFPPLNFTPIGAGGVPPFGQDMNGILKQLSQWSRWYSAGGPIVYDSAFSAAIGGYPKGSVILRTNQANWVLSTADNNTSNPDIGGANWTPLYFPSGLLATYNVGVLLCNDGSLGLTICATSVSAGAYTRPKITVNAQGQLTTAASGAQPVRVVLTGASSYGTPANAVRLHVTMVAGGGGGGGSGTSPTSGGAGAPSIFGGTTTGGGQGGLGAFNTTGGAGGAGGFGGSDSAASNVVRLSCSSGGSGLPSTGGGGGAAISSGSGAQGPLGGAGLSVTGGGTAINGINGTGGGGSGGPSNLNAFASAGGGGCGEYVDYDILSPSPTYSFSVGAGGTQGIGNSGNGALGGNGTIIVTAYFD